MVLKEVIRKITQNFKVKCEFCKKSIKRKHAYFENVKLLEFVYPKKVHFCNETCCSNYKNYEINSPRKASLCSSCPTPPGLLTNRARG